MRNPPPLFDFAPPPQAAQPAPNHVVTAGFGPSVDEDCWAIANKVANAVLDADTLAEIDAIAARHAEDLQALTAKRRDLALNVSDIFKDQRRLLGGAR